MVPPPQPCTEKLRLIRNNVIDICTIVSLTAEEYKAVLSHLSKQGLPGGVTYDALIVHAGIKAGADRIITLNQKDSQRVYPEFADKIRDPSREFGRRRDFHICRWHIVCCIACNLLLNEYKCTLAVGECQGFDDGRVQTTSVRGSQKSGFLLGTASGIQQTREILKLLSPQ